GGARPPAPEAPPRTSSLAALPLTSPSPAAGPPAVPKTATRSNANVFGGQTVAALRKEIEENDPEELYGPCLKLIRACYELRASVGKASARIFGGKGEDDALGSCRGMSCSDDDGSCLVIVADDVLAADLILRGRG